MGLSSSKTTSKSTSQEQTSGTTTPQNPQWVTDSLQDWMGRLGAMGDADPYSFVAGASPLQTQAFENASTQLGGWRPQANSAAQMAQAVSNAGANLTPGTAGYTAARGNASTYNAPTIGASAGPLATAAARNDVGNPAMAQAGSLLDNFSAYQNPYTRDVVNAAMADFDENAGRTRAMQAAQGAKAGAFGGSRFALREAATEGELQRARSATQAGLLDQGFRTAAGLSQSDAANRQQTSLFNAGSQNTHGLSQFAADNQRAGQYADAQNNMAALQYGTEAQRHLAQAGMSADAARHGVDATNAFNQDYLTRADTASQFGADWQNRNEQFNAGQMEAGLGRQAGMAGLLGQLAGEYGQGTRADLALMGDLGSQWQQLEQAQRLAPIAQMQTFGSLLGGTPLDLFRGQTINTSGTASGTGTQTTNPSLFGMLLQAGQQAAQAYAAGA